MGRIYTVPMSQVAVAAAQDLWNISATANMAISLHYLKFGDQSATTVAILPISIRRFTGSFTLGSGGNAVTPTVIPGSNPAATFTARINDTSRSSNGSGASTTEFSDVVNLVNGYELLFAPEDRPIFRPSELLCVGLESAPGSAQTFSGFVIIEELF